MTDFVLCSGHWYVPKHEVSLSKEVSLEAVHATVSNDPGFWIDTFDESPC